MRYNLRDLKEIAESVSYSSVTTNGVFQNPRRQMLCDQWRIQMTWVCTLQEERHQERMTLNHMVAWQEITSGFCVLKPISKPPVAIAN
jgi:hypothetical protein